MPVDELAAEDCRGEGGERPAAIWIEVETEPPDGEEKVLPCVLAVLVAEPESGTDDDPVDERFGVVNVVKP